MTKDDIIRMAREAGAYPTAKTDGALFLWSESNIERFATLVAAAEREACAKVCEEGGKDESGRIHVQAWGCAKAIRARGKNAES